MEVKSYRVTTKTPQELRDIANTVLKEQEFRKQQMFKESLENNIIYLDSNAKERAEHGYFEVQSGNLFSDDILVKYGYTQDDDDKYELMNELQEFLNKNLTEHFTNLGFTVINEGNYITIRWKDTIKE